MELITFDDVCVISRPTGKVTEYDEPIMDTIYNDSCLYQEAGRSYSAKFISLSPIVFLPTNDVLVEINDVVDLVTENGRKRVGVIDNVRDIILTKPIVRKLTRIELKQTKKD